jgi:hypothetical protein
MNKLIPVFLLVVWETLAIYAEMYIAEHFSVINKSMTGFVIAAILMTIAWILLLLWYLYGYRAFNNIWVISAISITTIVIIEPILALILFKETPSVGTIVWFIFWSIWLFATLYK